MMRGYVRCHCCLHDFEVSVEDDVEEEKLSLKCPKCGNSFVWKVGDYVFEKGYVKTKKKEQVNHPSHYADGRKYEPIDVIADWDLNFALGSALKYISRAGRKDDIVQDLEKARWYIDYEIERLKNERSN